MRKLPVTQLALAMLLVTIDNCLAIKRGRANTEEL
jgi:hypothetical protein